MDFAFTPEEESFRAELKRFLDDELPEWWRGMFVDDERAMPETRRISARLAERGWLTMAWPPEFGGEGASVWLQTIVREEMWAHEEPRGPQYMNLNYIGPLIMRFGTTEQQQRFLHPMARGEVIWCQGFSEPDAGSDLASLATHAIGDGDRFVVNGQKVWTSYADAPADWCLLLVRTDPTAAKHRGISVLLVDMTTPGITVRPIHTMAGPHEFSEVFFDDVLVPRDCLLGEQDRGWDVVVEGLTFERAGIARYARAGRIIELLVEWAHETGATAEPDVRRKLAELRVRYEAARLLNYRAVSLQHAGEVPTTEASIARIHNGQLEQLVSQVGLELLGPTAQLDGGDRWAPLAGEIRRHWERNIPTTIAAGTLEVQKNVVAQRGLGLPAPELIVDLALSDEQQMLAESGRDFVLRSCPVARVRDIVQDPVGFDGGLWDEIRALGWLALAVPEAHGGSGSGILELAVLCEALGRGPVPSPLVTSTTLAALPIAWLGTDAQKTRWLPALASGDAIGTMAILEPGHRDEWSPSGLVGGVAFRGQKVAVPWAGVAHVLVVRAGDGLYLVEPTSTTVEIERHRDLGIEPLFAVELRDAAAEPLGGERGERGERVDDAFRRSLDAAAVAQLAVAVGAAERTLEMTVAYAGDRMQFGRPIGSFQAVAHRCVDMRTDLDACRYLMYRAAWALDREVPSALEVASALAYGTEALRRLFMHAHQVHGAIGFSTEHDLHLYTRAAKASELMYGSASHHLETVAAAMGLG